RPWSGPPPRTTPGWPWSATPPTTGRSPRPWSPAAPPSPSVARWPPLPAAAAPADYGAVAEALVAGGTPLAERRALAARAFARTAAYDAAVAAWMGEGEAVGDRVVGRGRSRPPRG